MQHACEHTNRACSKSEENSGVGGLIPGKLQADKPKVQRNIATKKWDVQVLHIPVQSPPNRNEHEHTPKPQMYLPRFPHRRIITPLKPTLSPILMQHQHAKLSYQTKAGWYLPGEPTVGFPCSQG